MTNGKRLFPGVTQASLNAKEKENIERQIRIEEAIEAEKQATRRRATLRGFGVDERQYVAAQGEAIKGAVFGGLLCATFWLCLSFCINGCIDVLQGKDASGTEWAKSVVNPFDDGKFAPTSAWYRQLAFLVVSVWIAIATYLSFSKDYRWYKPRIQAVDMMIGLENLGEKYNLNTRQVKHLVKNVSYIIQSMSSDERVYFDMLMEGKINIKNNKTFTDMAVAIMAGHLESHPKDAQLILDTFDERTLPDNLLFQCKIWAERAR